MSSIGFGFDGGEEKKKRKRENDIERNHKNGF